MATHHQIKRDFSQKNLKIYLEGIYKNDHFPSFINFHKTSQWVRNELVEMGIQANVLEFIADGKHTFGDWVTPKAWDAYSAKVTDLNQSELIIDYQTNPCSLAMGSGGTPIGGVNTELIYCEKGEDLKTLNLKDKLILCNFSPNRYKKEIVEKGGLGFMYAAPLPESHRGATRWVNAWADDPALWSMTDSDTECIGLSISTNTFDSLRRRCLHGEGISLHVDIQTKFYDGTLPVVEAFIPGSENTEILVIGHMFEQGANDNASGAAAMMEIARILSNSNPKKGIRFLFTSEIYGTLAYCHEHPDRLKNTLAAINIDSIAESAKGSGKMDLSQNPLFHPSFVNGLMNEVVEASDHPEYFTKTNFVLDDNLIIDPHMNIPCILVGVVSENWHTSYDTLDCINWELFNQTTMACATWVSRASNATLDDYRQLNHTAFQEWKESFSKKDISLSSQHYMADFIQEVKSAYDQDGKVTRVDDLSPNGSLTESGPIRQYFGTPSFSFLNHKTKHKYTVWNNYCLYVIFLCNGKRSIERIVAYLEFLGFSDTIKSKEMLHELIEQSYLCEKITIKSLCLDFKRIGIKAGDTLIVHSSMKGIGGEIEDGAHGVIRALLQALGADGTLIMPAFTSPNNNLDLSTEPSRLGLISEAFRQFPGVLRSTNATHSICAIGKWSSKICSDHETSTQLGENSPLHKASRLGAKVLHLGTDIRSCSIIHIAEAMAKVPYLHIGYSDYESALNYKSIHGEDLVSELDELPGCSANFTIVHDLIHSRHNAHNSTVGRGKSILYDATELLSTALHLLEKDKSAILCHKESCSLCAKRRKLCSA